jgi:hypothetical protein
VCETHSGDFKLLCFMHNCRHREAPKYLKELLETRSTTRSLRNNTTLDYIIPRNTQHLYGDRSISYGPLIWNKLPCELKCIKDIKLFKRTCKTYLFKEYLLEQFYYWNFEPRLNMNWILNSLGMTSFTLSIKRSYWAVTLQIFIFVLSVDFFKIMKLLFVQFWHLWFWEKRFVKVKLF